MSIAFDKDFTLTIGGKGVAGASTFPVLNPANEQVVAEAPDCSRAQLDTAVAAARAAFPAWSATPIAERRKALLAIAGVLAANLEDLKRLLTSEQGKPHADAVGDVMGGAYWCQAISGLDIPTTVVEDTAERRGETRHVPIGVVGAIAPWNFPIILAMFKEGGRVMAAISEAPQCVTQRSGRARCRHTARIQWQPGILHRGVRAGWARLQSGLQPRHQLGNIRPLAGDHPEATFGHLTSAAHPFPVGKRVPDCQFERTTFRRGQRLTHPRPALHLHQ